MHYQARPHSEAKLVRCTAGDIYDVIIDLRPESPTFKQWFAAELSADNRQVALHPQRVRPRFPDTRHNTELIYHHSAFHSPDYARGLRFDDPALNIAWPLPVIMVTPKDRSYPLVEN